jgi:polysaccharide deacetylase 2 family uncharacterized protein YibQ
MRGFLGGAVWGLVVAAVGLSVASLIAPQPAGNRPPEAPQVEPPASVAETGTAEEPASVEPPASAGEGPAVAEVGAPPAPVAGPELPVADRVPAAVPALEQTAEGFGAMPEEAQAPAVEVGGGDSATAQAPRAPAPIVPAPEVDVAAATEPAEPQPAALAAEVVEEPEIAMVAPDLEAETLSEEDPVPIEEDPAARLPVASPAAPEQPEAGDGAAVGPEVAMGDSPVMAGEVAGIAPPPDAEVAPQVPVAETGTETETRAFSLPQVGVERETEPPEVAEEAVEDVDLPGQNGEAALPGDRSGIRVNRPAAGEEAEAGAPEVAALDDFGADWDGGAGLPQIGIVLVDGGALPGGAAAVAALPMPVTVAIDPGTNGAAEMMAAYRAAGIEVFALARLPVGAMPVDVAVTYEAVFAILPEAVGVIDLGEGGLQAQSAVTEQAMAQLAAAGRGAVLQGGGLNMAARLAEEAGVPVAVIDRRLDAGGADAAEIRRTLDQAAFRARQGAEVVLVGGVDAETISALMLWGAARAAAQVDVAPVSVMLRGVDG